MSYTLVTGGAKNLGKEICLNLAKQKQNIIVHFYKSETKALDIVEEALSLGVKAEAISGNFSTLNGIKMFANTCKQKFPNIKNLVNNVGNYLIKGAVETTIEEMDNLFCSNLYAPLYLVQTFIEEIKEQQGSIVNIGVAGLNQTRAESYSTAYSLTKLSLLMLTKSLAKELAPFNVTVNMVSPGILEGSIDAPFDLNRLPMKRLGQFSEVADVVAFLLNQKNPYITGQNIEIAGGVRL